MSAWSRLPKTPARGIVHKWPIGLSPLESLKEITRLDQTHIPFGTVVRDTWWPNERLIMVTGRGTGIILRDAQAPVGCGVEFDPEDPRIVVVEDAV